MVGKFDGVQFTYGVMLVIVILLIIFGSTDLEDLNSAP